MQLIQANYKLHKYSNITLFVMDIPKLVILPYSIQDSDCSVIMPCS